MTKIEPTPKCNKSNSTVPTPVIARSSYSENYSTHAISHLCGANENFRSQKLLLNVLVTQLELIDNILLTADTRKSSFNASLNLFLWEHAVIERDG